MTDLQHNTLPKAERLYCRKDISELLAHGKFIRLSDIKMCVRTDNGCGYSRIMVSVPKKIFKRAVKRNLLKRRIREAYRLQKHTIDGLNADILFVYNTKEILSSEEIFRQIGLLLQKVGK